MLLTSQVGSSRNLLPSGTYVMSPAVPCTRRLTLLAERAVRSAKHLLEKCARDGTDRDAALLSLCNMPRDGLPSPAQRLLSWRTRAFIPMTKAMYSPRVETQVKKALTQARQRRRAYYNKSARPLAPLRAEQTVRMQTQRGHDRLATVLEQHHNPTVTRSRLGRLHM